MARFFTAIGVQHHRSMMLQQQLERRWIMLTDPAFQLLRVCQRSIAAMRDAVAQRLGQRVQHSRHVSSRDGLILPLYDKSRADDKLLHSTVKYRRRCDLSFGAKG